MDSLAREAIGLWDRLKGERGTWEVHWQEVGDYIIPNRSDYIIRRTPGMKRMQKVFDSTPLWALEQFAAGMHSLLTSPSLQWFWLRADDDRLNQSHATKMWLDDTSARMYAVFNGPKHNFAAQSNELYLDLGSIGTAAMGVLEHSQAGILFSTRHMRECCVQENEQDRIDTLVRRWEWTAKQAFDAWGKLAGEKVLKALEDTPERKFPFVHLVRPRRDRNPDRSDARHKPFQSVYVSESDGAVIAEGGFDEFLYLVPRFSKSVGETYGRGPGMTALPDVKMLNEMSKTVLKAAQKIVDPPLQVPDDGFLMPLKTVPGGLNYYRAGSPDRIEPIQTDGQVPFGVEMLNGLRQQIIRAFYVEWMLMPSDPTDPAAAGKGVTATYVLQNRDEKMRLLSPMLARLQSEFLGPLIDRTFAIMWRQSMARRFGPGAMLAQPPAELSGVPLRVEYVSPIAVAQRTSQLDAIQRLVQTAVGLMQLDPMAAKSIDAEGILRLTARDLNTPAIAMKSAQQVAEERAAQQEAEQAMAQQAQVAGLAKAAKDGSAAVGNLAQAGALGGGASGPAPAIDQGAPGAGAVLPYLARAA